MMIRVLPLQLTRSLAWVTFVLIFLAHELTSANAYANFCFKRIGFVVYESKLRVRP